MVLQDDEKHHSPCGTTTLDNMALFKLKKKKVFTLNGKKNPVFCSRQTVDCKLEYFLFYAFYSFSTVCTGAQ